jgi:hypothetical protein
MNHAQTWMRSALQAIVLLGVLGAGGAWGQEAGKTELRSGCFFFLKRFSATVFKTDGQCTNELASGDWVYGAELVRDTDTVQGVFVKSFVNGQAIGVDLMLTKTRSVIFLVDPNFTNGTAYMAEFLSADGNVKPREVLFRMIDDAVRIAREKNLPVPNVLKVKTLVSRWHADRDSFVNEWMKVSSNAPSNNKQTNGADDPKVFGRSARGG